jgi:hypothetical protein
VQPRRVSGPVVIRAGARSGHCGRAAVGNAYPALLVAPAGFRSHHKALGKLPLRETPVSQHRRPPTAPNPPPLLTNPAASKPPAACSHPAAR